MFLIIRYGSEWSVQQEQDRLMRLAKQYAYQQRLIQEHWSITNGLMFGKNLWSESERKFLASTTSSVTSTSRTKNKDQRWFGWWLNSGNNNNDNNNNKNNNYGPTRLELFHSTELLADDPSNVVLNSRSFSSTR